MKVSHVLAALASTCLATAGWATPTLASDLGGSVTIGDANYSGTGWYGNHEDNETEANPFTIKAQSWDLEGMYLNGSSLTMVGGFNFQAGNTYNGYTYKSGDLFIDVDGNAVYGQAANGGSGTSTPPAINNVANTFGYDYVIHFNTGVTAYDVYQINSQSRVTQVQDVAASNPWTYVSGGTLIAQNVAIGTGNIGQLSSGVYSNLTTFGSTTTGLQGYNGDNHHYYLTVDTSFLPTSTATFHYTMECGNDNLMGRASVVHSAPDSGSSALLLALGLLPLGLPVRRWLARR